jgi:hypothetical protein
MSDWRALIADLRCRCTEQLHQQLLFGLLRSGGAYEGVELPSARRLHDDWLDLTPGHSFINHPQNAAVLRGWDT